MFGFMVMVRLPNDILLVDGSNNPEHPEKPSFTDTHAGNLQDILHYDFKVEVLYTFKH